MALRAQSFSWAFEKRPAGLISVTQRPALGKGLYSVALRDRGKAKTGLKKELAQPSEVVFKAVIGNNVE